MKISGKTFQRGNQSVSQVGDYLRACGVRGVFNNEQQQADAVESTAGLTYEVNLDWRAYNSRTGFSLEGMDRFPKTASGEPQSWVEDPTEKDENGKPTKVRANLIVPMNGFIPAI